MSNLKKILFVTHHYAGDVPHNKQYHSARVEMRDRRIASLTECITSIHRTFGGFRFETTYKQDQPILGQVESRFWPEVIVCVHKDNHVLNDLRIPNYLYQVASTDQHMNPLHLGFVAQKVLAQKVKEGKHDFYCHIEDDLVFSDPTFFDKLHWFNECNRPPFCDYEPLLVPNRFETDGHKKCFVDGHAGDITRGFQQRGPKAFRMPVMDYVNFVKPDNVYSGCYFLNQRQADKLTTDGFYDKPRPDYRWIGPLESAMTLALLQTFTIYKPELNSGFLEVQHYGNRYAGEIKG